MIERCCKGVEFTLAGSEVRGVVSNKCRMIGTADDVGCAIGPLHGSHRHSEC